MKELRLGILTASLVIPFWLCRGKARRKTRAKTRGQEMDLFLHMYLIKILSEYHENFIYQQLLNKENKTLHEKNYFHIEYFVISL